MNAARFEDLIVWRKAKALCVDGYRLGRAGPFARDFGLRDQVQRAAVPGMSNIAEGFERNSRAEFCRFLMIARGSLGEVRSQRYLVEELGCAEPAEVAALRDRCTEIKRMVVSLRKSLGG